MATPLVTVPPPLDMPAPVTRWVPLEAGPAYDQLTRLLARWTLDGRQTKLGEMKLSVRQAANPEITWVSVEDMSCAGPNYEPIGYDLVPPPEHLPTYRQRRCVRDQSCPSYHRGLARLHPGTWYRLGFGCEPETWLAEVRTVELPCGPRRVAALVQYGSGLVLGHAVGANETDHHDVALLMAALEVAVDAWDMPKVLVVPCHGLGLHRQLHLRMLGKFSQMPFVRRLADWRAPGTVASVNLAMTKLVRWLGETLPECGANRKS